MKINVNISYIRYCILRKYIFFSFSPLLKATFAKYMTDGFEKLHQTLGNLSNLRKQCKFAKHL